MRIQLWKSIRIYIFGFIIVYAIVFCRRFHAAVVRARSIPFSPLMAKGRVGSEYLDRYDIDTTGDVAGEVDDFEVFSRPDFDPGQVHPAVRRFYEQTTEYRLVYDVTWHRGFRIGAALVSPFTRWIEQLNLPGPGESGQRELQSRIVGLAARADPRKDARAWIRVNPTNNEAVFVAIYAHHQRDGITYTNIAVPLPGMNLSTVLHVDTLKSNSDTGVTLTTNTDTGDEGLYLVTPLGAVTIPMQQRFRVWPADTTDQDTQDPTPTDRSASIVATHEMWIYGRKFLTVEYRGKKRVRIKDNMNE